MPGIASIQHKGSMPLGAPHIRMSLFRVWSIGVLRFKDPVVGTLDDSSRVEDRTDVGDDVFIVFYSASDCFGGFRHILNCAVERLECRVDFVRNLIDIFCDARRFFQYLVNIGSVIVNNFHNVLKGTVKTDQHQKNKDEYGDEQCPQHQHAEILKRKNKL